MKCPKCGYTSFDYLRECKKCGEILDDCRQSLNLKMLEPTLFTDMKDKVSGDLVDDSKPTPKESRSSFPDPDLLPPTPTPPANQSIDIEPSDLSTSGEPLPTAPSKGISRELGSLGSMNNIKARPKEQLLSEELPKIELDTTSNEVVGLELTPSFNADDPDTPSALSGEDNKKDKFSLFEDESNEQADLGELINDDVPFEFTANDIDSGIKEPSANTDNDLIELELDMDNEESLDQILADIQTDK